MRPTIRLAALMGVHVVYVFTHDSVALGEDGPTHQPIEQLASLRAIPRLTVIRPADANETAVAWRVAIEAKDHPVLLALTRQGVPTLDRTRYASADGLRRGAYVLSEAHDGKPALILLGTGSEVGLILAAAEQLQAEGIAVRCVSMPSWELFDAQPPAYRDEVLPPSVGARLAVEMGVAQGWERYLGPQGVRSNLVAAGPLHTRAAGAIPGFEKLLDAWERDAPIRWDPSDNSPVADAVCFLLSDLARAITGEILHVDGGYHAMA